MLQICEEIVFAEGGSGARLCKWMRERARERESDIERERERQISKETKKLQEISLFEKSRA